MLGRWGMLGGHDVRFLADNALAACRLHAVAALCGRSRADWCCWLQQGNVVHPAEAYLRRWKVDGGQVPVPPLCSSQPPRSPVRPASNRRFERPEIAEQRRGTGTPSVAQSCVAIVGCARFSRMNRKCPVWARIKCRARHLRTYIAVHRRKFWAARLTSMVRFVTVFRVQRRSPLDIASVCNRRDDSPWARTSVSELLRAARCHASPSSPVCVRQPRPAIPRYHNPDVRKVGLMDRLVVLIGLLSRDEDLITPIVLAKDRPRYESTDDGEVKRWLEERAARRGGRGSIAVS